MKIYLYSENNKFYLSYGPNLVENTEILITSTGITIVKNNKTFDNISAAFNYLEKKLQVEL